VGGEVRVTGDCVKVPFDGPGVGLLVGSLVGPVVGGCVGAGDGIIVVGLPVGTPVGTGSSTASGWETGALVGSETTTSDGSRVNVGMIVGATPGGGVDGRGIDPSFDFLEVLLLIELLSALDLDAFLEFFDDPSDFPPLPDCSCSTGASLPVRNSVIC
jgi:hypothetical protein